MDNAASRNSYLHAGTCQTCGKRQYRCRADAKRAASQQRNLGKMSAYRCGDYWHLGHLPKGIAIGVYERSGERVSGQ